MILKLIADLHDPDFRHQAAIKLAEHLGGCYFMVFIKDPEIDTYLPGPGFTQTLYGRSSWDHFITNASHQTYYHTLCFPDGETRTDAIGFPGPEESVIVILGTLNLSSNMDKLTPLLPLIIALLKQEQTLITVHSLAITAEKQTAKAEKLTSKLDLIGQNLRKNLIEQQKDKEAIKELMLKKDEFMNIASHELKTPITSMKAYLQLISKKLLPVIKDEQLSTFIEKSNKQVDKLVGLITDLLDINKIQAGKMKYTFRKFNFSKLIYDSVEEIMILSSRHKIIINISDDLEINGDRMRIEQVLTNLLSNAIKYSPKANKVLLNVIKEENEVKVNITDFGIGLNEKQLPHIFDRFFRVENNGNRFFGLGLGLYISSEIIKRHKGTIGVESQPGLGSTFWFKLPIRQKSYISSNSKEKSPDNQSFY